MKRSFKMPTGETVSHDMPEWKTPYNHDTLFEAERTSTFFNEESLTKQEFKDETDINKIMDRLVRFPDQAAIALPEDFADLTGRTSYFDMASRVAEAKGKFYLLPAQQRAEFLNDPTRWADAVVAAVDRGDRKTLAELGIEVPPEEPPKDAPPRVQEASAPPRATPGAGDKPTPPKAPTEPKTDKPSEK